MTRRVLTLIDDDWRDGSGNYSLAADTEMADVVGLTAPWLGQTNGSVEIVFATTGAIAGDFLIEASDDLGENWVEVLATNVPTTKRFARWRVAAYELWRATLTNFAQNPAYGNDNSITVRLEG